ncbi:soluble calcium-activated nucleotidase 1 isoform X2 [Bemisia tabaci]|uniref:soluble calcium-activated nucleotidase 1 isoform X2 n=1 Tax=Bemisia tabaci TaxID=7038 RepID=UPI003B27F981
MAKKPKSRARLHFGIKKGPTPTGKDIGIIILLLLLYWTFHSPTYGRTIIKNLEDVALPTAKSIFSGSVYNRTYPLSAPFIVSHGIKYKIAIISDLDENSKKGNKWISYLKKGYLTYNPTDKRASVEWDNGDPVVLSSGYSLNGRGMELSELVVFDGRLLSVDDRTGIIYEIDTVHNKVYPRVLLPDGNGKSMKGFKAEWATAKDETLYVGGMGKEWTTSEGILENYDPQWIKTVSPAGEVKHFNWRENYIRLRRALQVEFPGYMIHESCAWSAIHKRWYFLPRRSSRLRYNDKTDEFMGTNVLLSTDADFSSIMVTYIGEIVPTHGFSSLKFIPDTGDMVMVALKSEEDKGVTATYVIVFTISGDILLPETKVADLKYEGIEFI